MFEMLWALFAIILIDIVLAGDNALVIGMAANRLPVHLRQKVILFGTIGAILIRFVSIVLLSYLLLIPGLRLIGGLALIYIGWKLAFMEKDHTITGKDTFWGAIGTIVVADAVMGIDNALGIAAAADGNFYLVLFGLLVSIPIILFGSTLVSKILEKYPDSIFIGSFVLFVVACKMILKEPFMDYYIDPLHDLTENSIEWIVPLVLLAKQYYRARIRIVK